ncbi:MAG: hypothetical protein AAGN15_15750 [Cyanobacteria bacterium J06581_3]
MKGIIDILKRVTPITPNSGEVKEAIETLENNLDPRTLEKITDDELSNYTDIVRKALGEKFTAGPIDPRWEE